MHFTNSFDIINLSCKDWSPAYWKHYSLLCVRSPPSLSNRSLLFFAIFSNVCGGRGKLGFTVLFYCVSLSPSWFGCFSSNKLHLSPASACRPVAHVCCHFNPLFLFIHFFTVTWFSSCHSFFLLTSPWTQQTRLRLSIICAGGKENIPVLRGNLICKAKVKVRRMQLRSFTVNI